MKKFSIIFVLIIFGATGLSKVNAQIDSCIIRLNNAGTLYEQGDYDGTIKMLNAALAECNLSKTDKIQANKLLIMSYLKVDNLEEAEKTAEKIMKIDPYYAPDKFKDDPKLSALFEKYKAIPQFRVDVHGGVNFTMIDVINKYSIIHEDGIDSYDDYNSKTGFQVGVAGEYRVCKDLWAVLELNFRKSKYEHKLYEVEGTTINYSEELSYFDIPVSAKYEFLKGKVRPYIQGGATFSFLSESISTTSRDDQSDLIDRTDLRNDFMMGYFGGAGFSYALKGLRIFIDVRYSYYPENVNKEGTRYADQTNVFKYYYIDDDFRLDNMMVNAGVGYVLSYKNKKVK